MGQSANYLMVGLSIATTAICWGAYAPVLHNGQTAMGAGRLRPFICVGIAYFLIAIVVPLLLIMLGKWEMDDKFKWTNDGIYWSLGAGVAGAVGALGIILAFTFGGTPQYVAPLVFGFAPIVNVITSVFLGRLANKQYEAINPIFFVGLVLVSLGAVTVLSYAPKPLKGGGHGTGNKAEAKPVET